MESRLTFRPRRHVSNPSGTQERRISGFVDWPCKGVGASRDLMPSARRKTSASDLESTGEKSGWEAWRCPYRKPTQVGEASSLR